MARKKLSEKEKEERQDFLAEETIEARTIRVLNPRINRLLKNMKDLTKNIESPRYKFDEEQKEKLTVAIEKYANVLMSAIEGSNPDEQPEDIL